MSLEERNNNKSKVKKTMFVSIVVISKDRRDDLEKAIKSLKHIDYPVDSFEIVIVDEGDMPSPFNGVNYVFLPRRNLGLGYARNTGVKNAKGEIIVFTDDDCIADPAWLKEIVTAFKDPEVMGVAGATFAQGDSLIGICEDILGFPGGGHRRYHQYEGRTGETRLLSGCNCSYRRKVFKSIFFKEDGFGRLGADDYLLGITVARQWKCLYVPSAIVYHKPRGSLRKIVSWFSRRRINELLFEETEEGKKKYKFLFKAPHKVMLFRLSLALIIISLFGWIGAQFICIMALIWYLFIFTRSFPVTRYFKTRMVIFLVPIVRSFMDLGVLVAEWKYLTQNHEKLGMALNEYRR